MQKSLDGQKVLFIVAPKNFRDEELFVPKRILEEAGATVILTSPEGGEAVGMQGAKVSTISITEPRTQELSGAVVVGGSGSPLYLWGNGLVQRQLRMLERDKRPIGAICLSVVVLAKAGLLTKKRATVFVTSDSLRALKEGGAIYEKKPVVMDGDVVTADGPESAERFAVVFRGMLEQKKALAAHR